MVKKKPKKKNSKHPTGTGHSSVLRMYNDEDDDSSNKVEVKEELNEIMEHLR